MFNDAKDNDEIGAFSYLAREGVVEFTDEQERQLKEAKTDEEYEALCDKFTEEYFDMIESLGSDASEESETE